MYIAMVVDISVELVLIVMFRVELSVMMRCLSHRVLTSCAWQRSGGSRASAAKEVQEQVVEQGAR